MQFTNAALLLTFASTISAQISQLPTCAQTCLENAFTTVGCSVTDTACQCGDKRAQITTDATPCVLSACSAEEALLVQSITSKVCSDLGSSSSFSEAASSTDAATSSSVEAATSSTEAVTSSTEAPASSTTTEAATTCSVITSVITTCAAVTLASSAEASASSAVESVSSAATNATTTTTSSASSTSSAAEQFTGAANKAQVGMGMVMGAVAAAMAL